MHMCAIDSGLQGICACGRMLSGNRTAAGMAACACESTHAAQPGHHRHSVDQAPAYKASQATHHAANCVEVAGAKSTGERSMETFSALPVCDFLLPNRQRARRALDLDRLAESPSLVFILQRSAKVVKVLIIRVICVGHPSGAAYSYKGSVMRGRRNKQLTLSSTSRPATRLRQRNGALHSRPDTSIVGPVIYCVKHASKLQSHQRTDIAIVRNLYCPSPLPGLASAFSEVQDAIRILLNSAKHTQHTVNDLKVNSMSITLCDPSSGPGPDEELQALLPDLLDSTWLVRQHCFTA